MTILDQAKTIADDSAREIGGEWVVIGNPAHRFTQLRDVCITEAYMADAMMQTGDVILYRTEG